MPAEVIDGCLNGAFHNEIKGLYTILFYSNYRTSLSAHNLAEAFIEIQGNEEVPLGPPDPRRIARVCQNSLGRIAEVVIPTSWHERSGDEKAWGANPEYYMGKLGLAGFTSYFGLQFPYVSLRAIYGRAGRAPAERHKICETLALQNSRPTAAQLATSLNMPYDQVSSHVDHLDRIGVIEKETAYNRNSRVLINGPVSSATDRQYKPETLALISAVENLDKGTVLSVGDLLDRTLESNPEIDSVVLRKSVRHALKARSSFLGLKLLDQLEEGIAIVPSIIEPITILCEGIKQIREGSNVKAYTEYAIDLLDKPSDVRSLIEKAQAFSIDARSEDQTMHQILHVLKAEGACRLDDLHIAFGERIKPTTIRKIVNKLVAEGKICRDPLPLSRHTERVSYVYRLPEAS